MGIWGESLVPIPKDTREAQARRRFPPEDEKGKDERKHFPKHKEATKNHEQCSQMLYVWER